MSWLAIDGQVIPYGSIISRFAAVDADAVPRCSSWFVSGYSGYFWLEMRRSKMIFLKTRWGSQVLCKKVCFLQMYFLFGPDFFEDTCGWDFGEPCWILVMFPTVWHCFGDVLPFTEMEGFLCSQRSTSWSWSSETFPAKGWALNQVNSKERPSVSETWTWRMPCLWGVDWMAEGVRSPNHWTLQMFETTGVWICTKISFTCFFWFLRLLSRGYDVSAIGLGGRVGNSTVGTSWDHEVEWCDVDSGLRHWDGDWGWVESCQKDPKRTNHVTISENHSII